MNTPVTLSVQLAEAARILQMVEQGRSLSDVLPKVAAGLRPGVQALVFHALRHWGEAIVLTRLLSERRPKPAVRALLGVALTLLLNDAEAETSGSQAPAYAPHTVVNQAVAALAGIKDAGGAKGFVNACLRRFLREQGELLAEARQDELALWNHPQWWIRKLQKDHPEHWQGILQANNRQPPMTLRINRRRIGRDEYLKLLQKEGFPAVAMAADGVVLASPRPVEALPGFAEGWFSVQDAAAQLAAPLLLQGAALPERARVLDACAAPGGKTAHLLECADLDVLALDVDPTRCQRIIDNLKRLGLQADVRAVDAGEPRLWWDGRPFDAILLDAPCTASGIVRRHPDVRWLRRPDDVEQLSRQQRRLLRALWPLLQPGGRMLYCTCSVFKAEGELQVMDFLREHPDARLLPAPGHLLPPLKPVAPGMNDNPAGGYDGFFYALLEKPL